MQTTRKANFNPAQLRDDHHQKWVREGVIRVGDDGTPGYALNGAERLKGTIKEAVTANQNNCSGAVRSVVRTTGTDPKFPQNATANGIVDYLDKSDDWREISPEEAQSLANKGTLVIAGAKGDLRPETQQLGSGHVAMIMPGFMTSPGPNVGRGDELGLYPMAAAGSSGGPDSAGFSMGDKTSRDMWSRAGYARVKFWARKN